MRKTQVDVAIAKAKRGNSSELIITRFKKPRRQAADLAKQASSVKDDISRNGVIVFAAGLEEGRISPRGDYRRSDNAALAAELVRVLKQDQTPTIRATAADAVRDLFTPAFLDRYAREIGTAAGRWKQREILLLWGSLPSTGREELLSLLPAVENGRLTSHVLQAIRARHGDAAAESRLLSTAQSLSTVGLDESQVIIDALAYVPTRTMKENLVAGLRSEEMLEFAGGDKIPKRNLFAYALVKMMRDDDRFPIKIGGFAYSAADLDQMEQWAAQYLDMPRPSTPMEDLHSVPNIEPVR